MTTATATADTAAIEALAERYGEAWNTQDLDGILMANSLHYIKDKAALLQKLRTYMRPEAPMIIVEYDTDQPVSTWVPYPTSFTSLTRLFANLGYSHIQKLGERPSAYGRSQLYAAIALPAGRGE